MAKRKSHCLQHSIAPHFLDAGAVMVMASEDTAYLITACTMGMVSDGKSHHDNSSNQKGQDNG